jgi:hypothetical protein
MAARRGNPIPAGRSIRSLDSMTIPSSVRAGCEELLSAYRAKGVDPGPELSPGLTDAQIDELTKWFPARLPDELREPYRWHNGQPNDAWNTRAVFNFRDMQFCSLERAQFEYESMMESYGVDNSRDFEGIELRTSFPFASFNGGWYVYPCDGQDKDPKHPFAIVVVFQDISVHFHSIVSMLATCADWKRASRWSQDEGWDLTPEAEMAIWQRHNPGVFGRAV